ncbi:MAG: universal stress protein [Myxococcota bacterium]
MTSFRHAVVGLDVMARGNVLTPGCQAALAHVRWLAGQGSLRCTLVHSDAPDESWDPESRGFEPNAPAQPDPLEAARADLEKAGIQTTLVVTEERAPFAILRAVHDGPCDLVLVGKRTAIDPDGPPVGSTATKLLRKCPCAVWAVRPGATPPPTRILAASDLSEVGRKVLQRSAEMAKASGAELHVVHAIQLTMAAQLGRNGSEEEWIAERRGEVAKALRAELAAFDTEAQLHIGVTSPTRAVLECEAHLSPDLIVMGTVSRGGVPGLLLGNTAERLLNRLDTSLLALKPADFVSPIKFD